MTLDSFFFIGLPYIAIVLFFGGAVYRLFSGFKSAFRGGWDPSARGDYLWTTRSTGFFGRASIGPAALCLHWGVIILFVAHIVGLVGGKYGLAAWVEFFRWAGMFGGVLLLYGLMWAFARRLIIPQLRAMSTLEDYNVLALLIAIAALGLYQAAALLVFGVSYSAGPWLGGILKLQPDASLIAGAPLLSKLHIALAFVFFAYFPFTKMVHVFTFPIAYLWRPRISVRTYAGVKK